MRTRAVRATVAAGGAALVLALTAPAGAAGKGTVGAAASPDPYVQAAEAGDNIPIDAAMTEAWLTSINPDVLGPEAFAKRARARWGLDASTTTVRRLAAEAARSAGRGDSGYGIPLTPAEKADMDRRGAAARTDNHRVDAALAQHPGVAAGTYIDQAAGGVRVVLRTAPDAGLEQAVRAAVADSSRLVFKDAEYTTAELDAFDRTVGATALPAGAKLASHGVLVPVGRVEVGVTGDVAAARAALEKVVPADALLVRHDEIQALSLSGAAAALRTMGTQAEAAPPWRGGFQMRRSAYETRCQTGFIAQKDEPTLPDTYWVMTAGHCGEINTTWRATAVGQPYSTGYGIGQMRGRCFQQGCAADVAVINMNQNYDTNQIWLQTGTGSAITIRSITSQQGQGADHPGDVACISSVQKGSYICPGITHTSLDITVNGVPFLYMRRVNADYAIGGDSGGPVFSGNQAMGIISARSNDGSGTIYSHIADAIRTLGLRAVKQQP